MSAHPRPLARTPRRRTYVVAVALVLALLAAGCGGSQGSPSDDASEGLRVVASTSILGDVVSAILGDVGQVEVLMPPGQDPHTYAPSARQAAELREADLVVTFGLGLEEALLDVLAAAEEEGVEVLPVAESLDPLAAGAHVGEDEHADDEHADEEHADEKDEDAGHTLDDGHDHDAGDPHVWFDPVRMAEGARLIAARLAEVDDTLTDEEWTARGDAVATDLLAAHDEVAAILADIPDTCRRLVTNHDSLAYLAVRYDLQIIGTVIPGSSTQAEPSAQDVAALVETLRDTEVPAIFTENVQSTRLADTVASEVGRDIAIVQLYTDALGEQGSGAETYTGLLRTNARRIADALASC